MKGFLAGIMILTCQYLTGEEISKQTELRNAAHHFLWSIGDSVSRVMPLIQENEFTYRITFERPFEFVPDSLAMVFLEQLNLESYDSYTADVIANSDTIVYSFMVHRNSNKSVIPCIGRKMPVDNYSIKVRFYQDKNDRSVLMWGGSFLILFTLVSLGLYASSKFNPGQRGEKIGQFFFDSQKGLLRFQKEVIMLTDKECRLLELLVKQKGEIVQRETILKEVWNDDQAILVTRSIDVFISRLRKYLQRDDSIKLVAVHGQGYKLEINE